MTYHPVPTIPFLVGPDKATEQTRYDRGLKVSSQAPGSPLCAAHADLMASATEVIKENVVLKSAMDTFTTAEAAFLLAKTALGSAVVKWDGAYDVFVSTGERYAITPNDASTLGAVARGKTSHPLAMPLAVDFGWNPKKDHLRVHVHRAPGMRVVTVQISMSPNDPSSWLELDGNGAVHFVPKPAKGTWWVRVQSRTAKGKSDFTTPVSVIVK